MKGGDNVLVIIHDVKNPSVLSEIKFNYSNWREMRFAVLHGEIDAIAVVNDKDFRVFYMDDLKNPKTYFEAKNFLNPTA